MKKVSIIIPVYNNFNLTLDCVNSIQKYSDDFGDYEIVVSDDCSTDDTQSFFSTIDDFKYQRNITNRGFSFTCNRGADISSGDYLLFLNNDTILTSSIIPSFLDTFQKYDAGIVGAKLLYPDDTIQHAGVLIYPDLKVSHLFKGFPSDYHAALGLRRIKAVTGACLMIPRNLFYQLGMFDENFVNGFEDLDLCFKAIEVGMSVYVNSDISLYHFEEKTRRNFNKQENSNSKLITSKWRHSLAPELSILDEGFDFKITEYGTFYIVRKSFDNIDMDDIIATISREPLFFYGYKRLINDYLLENKVDDALNISKKLLIFEPTIKNFELLRDIFAYKGDDNSVKILNQEINTLNLDRLSLKGEMLRLHEKYRDKDPLIAQYYQQWLLDN